MARFLTDQEARLLNEALRLLSSMRVNAPLQSVEDLDHQAPEVYVALPPAAGIPGLSQAGTGTTPPGDGDTAGSATCNIYRISEAGILTGVSFTETVYNLSEAAVPRKFILVLRDKFGKWITDNKEAEIVGEYISGTIDPGDAASFREYFWDGATWTVTSPAIDYLDVRNTSGVTLIPGHKCVARYSQRSNQWLASILDCT